MANQLRSTLRIRLPSHRPHTTSWMPITPTALLPVLLCSSNLSLDPVPTLSTHKLPLRHRSICRDRSFPRQPPTVLTPHPRWLQWKRRARASLLVKLVPFLVSNPLVDLRPNLTPSHPPPPRLIGRASSNAVNALWLQAVPNLAPPKSMLYVLVGTISRPHSSPMRWTSKIKLPVPVHRSQSRKRFGESKRRK